MPLARKLWPRLVLASIVSGLDVTSNSSAQTFVWRITRRVSRSAVTVKRTSVEERDFWLPSETRDNLKIFANRSVYKNINRCILVIGIALLQIPIPYYCFVGKKPDPEILPCNVCKESKEVQVEILKAKETIKLCGHPCYSAFKFGNDFEASQCELCSKYFDKSVPKVYIHYNGGSKYFCSKVCQV